MKILFLCSSNIFRSQIAEAWFNHLSKNNKAESAALISPQERMHALVIRTMKEFGLDISKQYSKKLTPDLLRNADIIILMNKNLQKPFSLYKDSLKPEVKIEYWSIEDIIAKDTDEHMYPEFVKACETIRDKVKQLIKKYEQ